MTLDLNSWIQVLILGGLAGAIGQGARAVIGIKKVNDQASADNVDPKDLIVASRLFISLTIGFIAGALAAILLDAGTTAISAPTILGLAAAGYAGTDFIEGIISKVAPTTPKAAAQPPVPAPAAAVPAAPVPPADDYLG